MARGLLKRTSTPEAWDALFELKAESQYTRDLTFSSAIDLMGQVVTSALPSYRASFLDQSFHIRVSLTSPYNKLQGTSRPCPQTSSITSLGNFGPSSTRQAAPRRTPSLLAWIAHRE